MRRHAPHTDVMGKRDAGSDAPAKIFCYSLYKKECFYGNFNL